MNKIILAAPEIQAPITVYRGVTIPYFLTGSEEPYVNKGLISTTFDIDVAKVYAGYSFYLIKSTLQPGLKCLCIDGGGGAEAEVILPANTTWKIKTKIEDKDYIGYYEVEYN